MSFVVQVLAILPLEKKLAVFHTPFQLVPVSKTKLKYNDKGQQCQFLNTKTSYSKNKSKPVQAGFSLRQG
eukprot:m.111737 g.111737  ORF g.111737 m.111737 type:complete len:70 (+) comp13458_c0_seq2:1408-1617(+)